MLKAGDTWTGETLSATGQGYFDTKLFDATYSSTLASQTATYQGGATMPGGLTFSAYVTLMINAGQNSGAATTLANAYCRAKAIPVALAAAHAAADATARRILISSYGAGADPVLDGNNAQAIAILAQNANAWAFSHLEIKNYHGVGIWANDLVFKYGMKLDNINAHNNQNPTNISNPYIPLLAGRYLGCGFWFYQTPYMHVSNCTFDNNDAPHLAGGEVSYSIYDNVSANGSQYLHPFIQDATGIAINGGTYNNQCNGPGVVTGSAGLFLKHAFDIIVTGVTFSNTAIPFPRDGGGIDMEGGLINCALFDCTFSNNGGEAIEYLSNGGGQVHNDGTMVDNCTFTNNGHLFAANSEANLVGFEVSPYAGTLTFTRCSVTKCTTPSQPFLYSYHGYTGPTDTITAICPGAIFGPDNTVM